MELRIHHLFDMIRDIGKGSVFTAHPYGHSFHRIARRLEERSFDRVVLLVACDAVCEGCIKMQGDHCVDTVDHREDFTSKEAFNNVLDRRILDCLGLKAGQCISIDSLLQKAGRYLESIESLYEGNDPVHTLERKRCVEAGLRRMQEEE